FAARPPLSPRPQRRGPQPRSAAATRGGGLSTVAQSGGLRLSYSEAPSISVISSAARSRPDTQRRLISTMATPPGPLPSAKGAQPQVAQNWWRTACLLKVYSLACPAGRTNVTLSAVVK